jgi:hypothetical protein
MASTSVRGHAEAARAAAQATRQQLTQALPGA